MDSNGLIDSDCKCCYTDKVNDKYECGGESRTFCVFYKVTCKLCSLVYTTNNIDTKNVTNVPRYDSKFTVWQIFEDLWSAFHSESVKKETHNSVVIWRI